MKYSVSAVCLNPEAFEENVRALVRYPVADLHCDYFPEIDTARSLSLRQLEWCQRNWSRGITVHVWGPDGVRGVAGLGRRGRLLVQVHGSAAADLRVVGSAAETGWQPGVSLIPELIRPVVPRLKTAPVAVQILTTSTPGFVGGTLVPATWPALEYLRQLRTARRADWTIEVDGGLTEMAVDRLASRCDLGVLGSNYLRVQPATAQRLPTPLWEKNCAISSFTN